MLLHVLPAPQSDATLPSTAFTVSLAEQRPLNTIDKVATRSVGICVTIWSRRSSGTSPAQPVTPIVTCAVASPLETIATVVGRLTSSGTRYFVFLRSGLPLPLTSRSKWSISALSLDRTNIKPPREGWQLLTAPTATRHQPLTANHLPRCRLLIARSRVTGRVSLACPRGAILL